MLKNPIDHIIINSLSATPVVGQTIEDSAISVTPETNRGYSLYSTEWGTWNGSAFNPLNAGDTFEAGNTYAIRATLQADGNMPFHDNFNNFNQYMSDYIYYSPDDYSLVGTAINGGNLEIIFQSTQALAQALELEPEPE